MDRIVAYKGNKRIVVSLSEDGKAKMETETIELSIPRLPERNNVVAPKPDRKVSKPKPVHKPKQKRKSKKKFPFFMAIITALTVFAWGWNFANVSNAMDRHVAKQMVGYTNINE